ncbi:MAG: glycosyltransferase family 1 protein [Thermodesulfobacteriota bacterium]|nr:glycosyltransferase family 1 protein [Thermodesulfobacteriota bacterium]
MLDILIDYQIFSLQEFGGISRYFSEIAWRIDQLESCRVTLFCPLYRNNYLKNNFSRYNARGFYIKDLPRTGSIIRMLNKVINHFYGAVKKFDIIHKTFFWDKNPKGRGTIVTVYDMINELYPEFFPENDPLPALKAGSVRNADAIICISHNTKRDLLNIVDIDPEKVYVTQLGFSTLPEPDSRQNKSLFSNSYLLFVGKRSGHKNFSQMIKGFSSSERLCKDFQIVCFGDVVFSAEEKALLHSCGIKPNKIHHISGDDKLLSLAYRGAAAFVYPSIYEGFGIPPLEAMSCDCPVICSHAGSLPEVVGESAELFDPNDVDSIRCALENVLYSPDRSSELIKKGTRRYKQFTWERCARETSRVYSSI